MLTGRHLIAGEWVAGDSTFRSDPAQGEARSFAVGTPAHAAAACAAAEAAFAQFGATRREDRARLLERIAEEIDARGAAITEVGAAETGLPPARLEGERGRTTMQLRLFADHIRTGAYLDRRIDPALPDRQPQPRPEIRMIQRPVGPVAVFGASNFPLAFSVAGGDTASALAAGCPVVVKGHPAHPGTGELAAQAIAAAVAACGLPGGVFSMVQDGGRALGAALVQDPRIRAVGFTGSLGGGRALFDLCAARPDPIPFFGELGSINPMFLLPGALASRAAALAQGWAASLTLGAGQFCTNPGLAVAIDGPATRDFIAAARAAVGETGPQMMLSEPIAQAFRDGAARVATGRGVRALLSSRCDGRRAAPWLFEVSGRDWLADAMLAEEVFGPLGILVTVADADAMRSVAESLAGQLTCTLHLDAADTGLARGLMPVLERKAGRLIANGFPTGVEVCDAMVHGGPYPASTNFGATSVGTLAIRRWLRPVCFQNMPEDLLPEDLRGPL